MSSTSKETVDENCKNTSSLNVGSSSPVLSSVPSSAPSSTEPANPTCISEENIVKKRKLTSPVWNHFVKKSVNGEDIAICNYCKLVLKAGSRNGTKSLKRHLETCSGYKNQTIDKCVEKQKQIAVEKKNDGKVRFGNFTFDQESSRNWLASAIAYHEYPLSIVDHVLFRRFLASCQPLFKMVSRNTIKDDVFKVYNLEKLKLQGVLEKLKSRIAITTDMWTSNQRKGYMTITGHYISDSWVLESRILRFVYVPTPHTRNVLAQVLMNALTEWNIETKISTITVDNCSTNDGMISIISEKLYSELLLDGKILHMRCCAHILNLVVKDGLSIIDNSIENIRDSVAFWSASPSRVEKFEEMARQSKVPYSKKLSIDCRTRWNSTYLMLQTAIGYKELFPRLKLRDRFYTCLPSENDWEMASKIAEKLEIYYNATKLFSGTKYPTANCYFVQICQIRNAIMKWIDDDNEVICAMAKKMFEKFDKY